MQLLEELDRKRLASVTGVFTDIDDTISTGGKVTSEAFDAMWRLHDAGIHLVVVTGRPAGWCDHIARFWPVNAVVGENGGFYFYHDGTKLQRRYLYSGEERAAFRRKLQKVRKRILAEVPGAGIASDQPYREYDLAIDFCEDVQPLAREDILRIKSIFEDAGATAKVSSIHVNGWYGTFDKLTTSKLYVQERMDADLDSCAGRFLFCGDSANDEPMFKFFPLSIGMANIKEQLSYMKQGPAYVTKGVSGTGFRQVVDHLLSVREETTNE